MRACSCGNLNPDDQHFCTECKAYVAWDDTPQVATNGHGGDAQTEVLTKPARPEQRTERAVRPTLMLRGPGDRGETPDPVLLQVEPGTQASFVATVRNEDSHVRDYRITVDGFEDWWTAEPSVVNLLPANLLRGFEQDVVITLKPPRAPVAKAGGWILTVRAVAGSGPGDEEEATVVVAPFEELAFAPNPGGCSGRRGAETALRVTNTGNVPIVVGAAAADHEGRCVLSPPPNAVEIAPEQSEDLPIKVRPKKQNWFGWRIDHLLQLTPVVAGKARPSTSVPATYRQRPWIPWWATLVVLFLLVAALLLWLLLPHDATVPDVRNAPSAFVAQKELEDADLTMAPQVRKRVRRRLPAGTVLDQAPAPGEKVDKGKAVSLVIAVRPGRVRVPKLKGLAPAEADQRLQRRGLSLGTVLPKLDSDRPVAMQIPVAGRRRRRGTAVNIILAGAKVPVPSVVGLTPGEAEKKVASVGLKLGPVPADTPPGAKVTGQVPAAESKRPAGSIVTVVLAKKAKAAAAPAAVPAIAPGASAEAAAAALKEADLVPVFELRVSPLAFKKVVATVPGPGEDPPADKRVKVIVSAGFPTIAYDDGEDLLTAGGATGKPQAALADAEEVEGEPAWTPDGAYVLFRRQDDLLIASTGERPMREQVLAGGGRTLMHPAIAPPPENDSRVVVAFVSRGPDTPDRLCFTRLKGTTARGTSCRPTPGFALAQLLWLDGGQRLLVVAKRLEDEHYGLLRFSTGKPYSTDEDDWFGGAKFMTPEEQEVLAGAVSPGGQNLALITAPGGGDRQVTIVAPVNLALKQPETVPVQACQVAWRSDGRELLVVQSDARCTADIGRVLRVDRATPDRPITVIASGRNVASQPLFTGPISLERLSALERPR